MISYCSLTGHENNEVVQICTYPECNQFTRWMCQLCNNQGIHDHELFSVEHINHIDIFKNRVLIINYDIFQEKENGIDQLYQKYFKEIEQQIIQLQVQLVNQENKLIEQALHKFQDNPFILNKKELDSLVNFKKHLMESLNNLICRLKFVMNQCKLMIDRIEQITNSFQNENTIQCIKQQVKAYCRQKSYEPIGQFQIKYLSFGARISPDERRLIFCNQNGQLQLNNISSCRSLGKISIKKKIDLVSFNQKSNLIILCQQGALKILRVGKTCKLQSSSQLTNINQITKLIFISSNKILIQNNQGTIIIVDIVNHKQNLRLEFKSCEIDYDYQRQEIIIQYKNKISFYNNFGMLQFSQEFQQFLQIKQFQKIQNSDKILICANNQLNVMRVDYQLQKLILTHSSQLMSNYYFSLLCNNSLIALVSEYLIVMLDVNLIKIQLIPFYNSQIRVQLREYQQKSAINLIILQGEGSFEIIRLSDPK